MFIPRPRLSRLKLDTINKFNIIDLIVDSNNLGKVLRVGDYILWHNADLGVNELHIHHYDGENEPVDIMGINKDAINIYRPLAVDYIYTSSGDIILDPAGNLVYNAPLIPSGRSYIRIGTGSPETPSAGDTRFDDVIKRLKLYDGAEWKEIPRKWLYVEYSHPLVAVNVSGTTPYYFSTTSSSPVIVDFTFFDYGKVMANVRNIYGSSAQVIKRWVELQMATDTAGTPVYADLYNYTDDVQVAQVDTDINSKSNRMQIVLPELDESKVYVVRGWSSDGNAACVIGTVIFKQLIKFNEDEL